MAKWYYPNGEVEGSSGWGTEFGIDPGQTAEINIDAVFIPEAVVRYAVEIEFYAFEE